MTPQIETLYRMRDKALHRYSLAKKAKKRTDEEVQFCSEEVTTLNRLIEEKKGVK
jgi:hypothetical protein